MRQPDCSNNSLPISQRQILEVPAPISYRLRIPQQSAHATDLRVHDLRHTWASWHRQAGTSRDELKDLGGWESRVRSIATRSLAPSTWGRPLCASNQGRMQQCRATMA